MLDPLNLHLIATHPDLGVFLGCCLGHAFWSSQPDTSQADPQGFACPQETGALLRDGWPVGTVFKHVTQPLRPSTAH